MRRTWLVLLLLVGAAVSVAQDLNQKITYKASAIPLKKIMEELRQRTGVPFVVTPQLANAVMIIDVREVTVKDLMDRMAIAIEAEWQSDSAGTRLIRTGSFIRKKEAEEVQRRYNAVVKSQKKLQERLEKAGGFDSSKAQGILDELDTIAKNKEEANNDPNRWRRYQSLRDKLPKTMFAQRVAATLKPELMANMKDGDRIVLSSSPNRMQQPLPNTVAPAIQQLIRDQNVWAESLSRYPIPDFENGQNIDWDSYSIIQDRKRIDATPSKVLVILTQSDSGQMVSVEIRLLNAKGQSISSANSSISVGFSNDPEESDAMNKQMEQLRADAAKEPAIELSPLAKEFKQRVMARYEQGASNAQRQLSKELRNALLHPEQFDPLQLGATDVFFGMAQQKNLQVVAAPGDFMVMVVQFSSDKEGIKASELLGMMRMLPSDMNPFIIDDNWLVCRRGDFQSFPEFGSVDRIELGRILRQIDQDGRISLDTQCQIALSMKSVDYSSLYNMLPQLILGIPGYQSTISSNRNMLKLHGLLTKGQKQTLANGGKLLVGNLTAEQKQIVFDMVFKSNQYGDQIMSAPEAAEVPAGEDFGPTEWTPSEPTELLPNGLPRDTVLSLTLQQGQTIMVDQAYDGQTPYTQSMEPEQLGYYLAMKENPTLTQGDNYYSHVEWSGFRAADQTVWNYQLQLTPKAAQNHQLVDRIERGEKYPSIDKLPKEIIEKINKAKAEIVKNLQRQQKPPADGGGGGGGSKK